MKKLTLLLFCASICLNVRAQKIESKKSFGGTIYTYDGQRLNASSLGIIMKDDVRATSHWKKARSNSTGDGIFDAIGGGLIGFPLGTAMGGGDPNWTLAGAGVAVFLVGIPFNVASKKHMANAVNKYNENHSSTSPSNKKVEWAVIGNTNGIGIAIQL